MRTTLTLAGLLALTLAVGSAQAEGERKTPYWASISAGKAMMRTGPGRNYPATWLYLRADLPIKVVETYPDWRKVQDPEGTTGWMLQRLLADKRTALVTGQGTADLHETADDAAPVRFRAEPGVVGALSKCHAGWCRLDVGGRSGFVRSDRLWGLNPGEELE
jgi:SH3-like domain-containing protein